MKTMEVYEACLRGKRLTYHTRDTWWHVFKRFAEFSPEWPSGSVIINEYLTTLTNNGFSSKTVVDHLGILKSAGEYMRKNYDMKNPCYGVERVKVEKKKRRQFTADEELRILASCKKDYDRELILTLVTSLCRIGELGFEPKDPKKHPGLKGKDVKDGFIETHGKTDSRTYHLDKRICQALRNLAGGPDNYVFHNEDGSPVNVDALKMRVIRIVKRAGLTGEKLGAHTFRHTGASLMARFTQNPMLIQELLQHDKITTSMEYVHDAVDVSSVSVLDVLNEYASKANVEIKQLPLGESTAVVPYNQPVVEVKDSGTLTDDIFPEIKDSVIIHSRLKADDLKLLRRCFVVCFNTDIGRQDAYKGRELLKRMLRKT